MIGYTRQKIGEHLVDRGLLSRDQLAIALREQQQSREPIGRLLVRLGFTSEQGLRESIAAQLGHGTTELSGLPIEPAALSFLTAAQARALQVLPLAFDAKHRRLRLASARPNDLAHSDRIRHTLPADLVVELVLASESELAQAIDRHYDEAVDIAALLTEIEAENRPPAPATGDQYSHPIIRLTDALLADAVRNGASDIHFEPEAGFLRIRWRIDGLLHPAQSLHQNYWPPLAVRLKVLSGMNIAESRQPQDGQFTQTLAGRRIDFRCATQPTLHGENIVLRVLDRQRGIVPLSDLLLSPAQQALLDRMLARPEGLILVTGPTGSGKTTTLYSLIQSLNTDTRNIMTLEDPVEYPLPLVRQTSLTGGARIDFAAGIRALMRQDPDILLVGEIRDGETAEMAFRAAMTGHQVFSTLHCNSALGALPRLRDLGVRNDLLAENLSGLIAQRLVRRLCPTCRIPDERDAVMACLQTRRPESPGTPFRATGCAECHGRGYRGRLALWEMVVIDDALSDQISAQATTSAILRHLRPQGFRSLAQAGLARVADGSTSLDEVRRVVDLGSIPQ